MDPSQIKISECLLEVLAALEAARPGHFRQLAAWTNTCLPVSINRFRASPRCPRAQHQQRTRSRRE
jgi:hypothetical protein